MTATPADVAVICVSPGTGALPPSPPVPRAAPVGVLAAFACTPACCRTQVDDRTRGAAACRGGLSPRRSAGVAYLVYLAGRPGATPGAAIERSRAAARHVRDRVRCHAQRAEPEVDAVLLRACRSRAVGAPHASPAWSASARCHGDDAPDVRRRRSVAAAARAAAELAGCRRARGGARRLLLALSGRPPELGNLAPCRPWVRSPRCSTSGSRRSTPTTWDPVGLVVGDPATEVRRVLLAVDPVQAVVDEAVADDADLLVSHHPLFLKRGARRRGHDPKGRRAHRLLTQRLRAVRRAHQRRLASRRRLGVAGAGPRPRGRPPARGRPGATRSTRS